MVDFLHFFQLLFHCRHWEPNYNPTKGPYCNHSLYLFTFVIMVLTFSILLLILIFPLLLVFTACVQASNQKLEETELGGCVPCSSASSAGRIRPIEEISLKKPPDNRDIRNGKQIAKYIKTNEEE